jgi:hypothetical protein
LISVGSMPSLVVPSQLPGPKMARGFSAVFELIAPIGYEQRQGFA